MIEGHLSKTNLVARSRDDSEHCRMPMAMISRKNLEPRRGESNALIL